MAVDYDAICDGCGFEGEISKPMADEFPTRCPACKKNKLRQDYSKKSPIVQDLTPKTVGQQAERNAKVEGKEQQQIKAEKLLGPKGMAKRNAKTPWWRKEGSKPLDVTKIKDPNKFILTGDKT